MTSIFKRTVSGLVCMTALFLIANRTFAEETATVLAQEGKTDYVIVLPAEPTPVEQTAAKELKSYLDLVTGASFPIRKESEAETQGPQILVGASERLKKRVPDLDPAELPYDGIVVKTLGKDLVLAGHPQRGTLYAVNTFLEDVVGVRWWTSTESHVPKKPTLEIPALEIRYAPKLIYREAYYRDAFEGVFAARMKCNGNMVRIPPEYGSHFKFFHFVHSFFPLLPPDKYFKDHPEWYSEIGGVRKYERAQLCLTDEAMRAELTVNAIEGLRRRPDHKFISISQNDWHGYCECQKCTQVAEEEGSQAGPLIRFVNKVAEEIEKEFPDVWVETLAYQYTRKPPKHVRPRKNVVVRLCSIECSFVQPLGQGEQNRKFREDIQGWSKIADSLFIWDYTVNFSAYMLPHPNYRVLGPNLRFFVDHNTIGMFEQGDSFCTAGDFVRMKNWVLSRLMWDPTRDAEQLYDEFLAGYYGKAAPIVRRYMDLLVDAVEESGAYLGCYQQTTSAWLPREKVLKAKELMTQAIDAAEDETVRNRLRRDSIPIDLVLLQSFSSLKRQADPSGPLAGLFADPRGFVDDFFARCKEFDNAAYREGDNRETFERFEKGMRRKFQARSAPPAEFCKSLPPESWLEIQNFELTIHKPGQWTFDVDDPEASNGAAVKMPGDHFEWATSCNFDMELADLKPSKSSTDGAAAPKYRIYAALRCEATAKEGRAMTFGVYDYTEKKGIVTKSVDIPEIVGADYHWIELGPAPLKPNQNLWFAPPKRPGEVQAVYIDRIVVVRE